MSTIRILHIEDDLVDAKLIKSTLKKGDIDFELVLVDTRNAFVAAIEGDPFDLVLADYSLPDFDGLAALEILRSRGSQVPFILVSGALGEEEVAIEALKAGVTDYVLKHNLKRLVPAVRRALRETKVLEERRKAEAELRISEGRYRQLFERNLAGVFRSTIEGRILDCNEAFAKIFGYASREEAMEVGSQILYEDLEARCSFLDKLRLEGSVSAWEQPMRSRNGRQLRILENTSLVEDEFGELTIIEGSLIDFTERRALEQQLAQMQKLEALGHLAGGIAHDFNNLLMSISGSAELLSFRFSSGDTETQELTTIRATVARGAELTQRLLAIAHQQVLEMEATDLQSVIEKELNIMRRVIPENIQIEFLPSTGLPAVMADHGQLGQVLMNLIVNARDAMLDGGTITIGTESARIDGVEALRRPGVAAGPYVLLSVHDTGVGMDATTLARIFDPFFTTKKEGAGSGMGLATVYGIVKQHGGYLEVESAPGNGSRFDIYLPSTDDPTREKDSSGIYDVVGGAEAILVVEDEPAVRAAMVRMLEALGYAVTEAANGSVALEALRGGATVDLVLSDVVMPTMGGLELLENARELTPDLPFLFSSGYANRSLHDQLDAARKTSFIAKPFTINKLSRAVRKALSQEETE